LVLSEGNYQWLFNEGSYDDQLQRHQFWATMLDGGAGHTYGANGVWQINQPDEPFGPSPHGFVWGNTPWITAMNHAASTQLGVGKSLLLNTPWTKLVPASELVRFALPTLPPIEKTDARWVWTSDKLNGLCVVGTVFDIPQPASIRRATLRLACRARYGLSLNGQAVHRRAKLEVSPHNQHVDAWLFPLAGEYLKSGRNTILLRFNGEDFEKGDGLLAHVLIELVDGQTVEITSNPAWRWDQPRSGWPGDVLKLDPTTFSNATQIADGNPAPASLTFYEIETYGPRCAMIPGQIWFIYTPTCQTVELSGLPANAEHRVQRVDPRHGGIAEESILSSDAFGRLRCNPHDDPGDWLFIIRASEN
jgi:hypothetical protein